MNRERVYNFSAGSSMLPIEVLERAQAEMLNYNGTGMSVAEISNRSPEFREILSGAEDALRRVASVCRCAYEPAFLSQMCRLYRQRSVCQEGL